MWKSILTTSLLAFSVPAEALPDFIRKGYPSCNTCHVSTQGGGLLNIYGRGFSESLSILSYEGQGGFLFTDKTDNIKDPTGLFNVLKADFQADLRRISFWEERPELTQTNIMMEASLKAALHIGKVLTLTGSAGYYGQWKEPENRVYYADVRTSKFLTFTLGRFLPNYGIMLDDHTAFTRQGLGFGEGNETLNAAVNFENELVQATLTRVISAEVLTFDKEGPRYEEDPDVLNRIVLRSAIKWNQRLVTGLSALYDPTHSMAGIFALGTPIKNYLYLLGEFDWQRVGRSPETVDTLVYLLRVGSEPIRGVTLGLDLSGRSIKAVEAVEDRMRVGGFLQVFPTAHVEFKFESRWEEGEVKLLLMSHVWL